MNIKPVVLPASLVLPAQASLFDVLPALDTDRGECQELNADTLRRCTGRMVASYVEATRLLPAFPLWTCEQCGRVHVP